MTVDYHLWLSPPDLNEEPYDLKIENLYLICPRETANYYNFLRHKWDVMDFDTQQSQYDGDAVVSARCAFETARLRAMLFDLETMIFELWCRSEYFMCEIELQFVPDSTV